MRYVFLGERHSRREGGQVVRYKSGDEIELTDDEARRFAPGVVKPVKQAAPRQAILRTVDRPREGGGE